MMAVPITTDPSFAPGVAESLFRDNYFFTAAHNYDVSPDGRFLMLKAEGSEGGHINIVRNWVEELKARVPTE